MSNEVLPVTDIDIDLVNDPWNRNKISIFLDRYKDVTTNIHFVNGKLDSIYNTNQYRKIINFFMSNLKTT